MHFRSFIIFGLSFLLFACGGGVKDGMETDPQKIAKTNLQLAIGYLQQGRMKASMEKLQKALEAEPDYPAAHSTIALVYQREGELGKAKEHFRRALSLKPDDGATHNNFAVLLCQTGNYDEAEKHFLIALKSRYYKTPSRAFENLGLCAMQKPDFKAAEKHFRRALQINPRLPVSLLEMAKVSLKNKRYMSGRAYLQRFSEVSSPTAASLWLGIQIEKKIGDEAAVREYSDQLSRHFPDSDEMGLLLEMEKHSQ